MLETVREFGLELLAASGEETALREAHAAYFAGLVDRAAPALRRFNSAEGGAWRSRLAPDEANLRAALAWRLERSRSPIDGTSPGTGEPALRMAGALGWFWFFRGQSREGRDWLDRALAAAGAASPRAIATGQQTAAWLAWEHGDRAAAIAYATAALTTFRELGDESSAAAALHLAGMASQDLGDLVQGDAFLTEALAAYRAIGSAARAGQVLADLAAGRWATGDPVAADALFAESLDLIAGSDEPLLAVHPLTNAGGRALEQGELDRAAARLGEALAIARANDYARGLPGCFEGAAALAAARGEAGAAARLLAAAAALREAIGRPVPPLDRDRHERLVTGVRSRLGEAGWADGWAAGRRLTRAEAVAEAEVALATPHRPAGPRPIAPEPGDAGAASGLTEREVEVLRLLVAGRSNPEIAAALFISAGTVRTHVSNILAKLDARSRTEAVTVAHRLGLLG
jgi:DNA-binding CsgD family transcriptional regulator